MGHLLGVGPGQVEAPIPARHQGVAGEEVIANLEAEAAGGMTRRRQDLERKVSKGSVAVRQVATRIVFEPWLSRHLGSIFGSLGLNAKPI
jgi:hypothetical protein